MINWAKTSDTTVANSTTETTLLDTGVGFKTLNSDSMYSGKTIRVFVSGNIGTLLTPTFRLRLKLGSTVVLDTTAQAIDVTAQWGTANAANTVSAKNGHIEMLTP